MCGFKLKGVIMPMKIQRVQESDFMDIYQFEMRNRAFFETVLPPRPTTYNVYESFEKLMNEFMFEQLTGDFIMYTVRDEEGYLAGRINLQVMFEKGTRRAELGYRVDCNYRGKGVMTGAVSAVLVEAFTKLGIAEVVAGTAVENIASQRVLEKNGFIKIGEEKDVMEVNGLSIDGILYAIKRDAFELKSHKKQNEGI